MLFMQMASLHQKDDHDSRTNYYAEFCSFFDNNQELSSAKFISNMYKKERTQLQACLTKGMTGWHAHNPWTLQPSPQMSNAAGILRHGKVAIRIILPSRGLYSLTKDPELDHWKMLPDIVLSTASRSIWWGRHDSSSSLMSDFCFRVTKNGGVSRNIG